VKNNCSDSLQLLALVPHRDARRILRAWSASLFSKELYGAWSFPWVIPIAVLNRPLSGPELKNRALILRRTIDLSGGKCATGPLAVTALSNNVSVFGPSVNMELSDSFFAFEDNVAELRISPFIIGSGLCHADAPPNVNPPCLSFSAAALANMRFRSLSSRNGLSNDFSFEWEIDKLFWLPKP